MGRKTYEQVLGFGEEFPYKDKENYIFSKNKNLKPEYGTLISDNYETFYNERIKNSVKHFWLVGGARVNTLFLHNNWIDKIIITVTPIKLGSGIPLFNDEEGRQNLHLEKTLRFNKGWIQYYFTKTL
jgi:dihydrofolate reductase